MGTLKHNIGLHIIYILRINICFGQCGLLCVLIMNVRIVVDLAGAHCDAS